MCGVVGAIGANARDLVERGVSALDHRGPDARGIVGAGDAWLGHTRLAILDLDPRSDQPFVYGDVLLSYNGELWNFRELRAKLESLGCDFATQGDTEVVAAALNQWGRGALERMNGMFALAWTTSAGVGVSLARDRFGEVPLHFQCLPGLSAFASEMKALRAMGLRGPFRDVGPGEVVTICRGMPTIDRWYEPSAEPRDVAPAAARKTLRDLMRAGVTERAIADVKVCTLLSGGIDSAAVALDLSRLGLRDFVAYTAVYDAKSRDLRCAREVAESTGVPLREVAVPCPSPDDLAQVVDAIEMPHKAQVEIGWPCLVLARAMQADGYRVTFSGEGSDELWASYGFGYHGVQAKGWHTFRKDLFLDQHRKNFARCNKVFMRHGVECRLPFLHPPLVEYALGLRASVVRDGAARPKAIIQDAFAGELPESVTSRPKVAFQDGLGIKDAVAGVLGDPRRFYAAEFKRRYAS